VKNLTRATMEKRTPNNDNDVENFSKVMQDPAWNSPLGWAQKKKNFSEPYILSQTMSCATYLTLF